VNFDVNEVSPVVVKKTKFKEETPKDGSTMPTPVVNFNVNKDSPIVSSKTKEKEEMAKEGLITPVVIAIGLAAIAVGAFFILRRR
jgi:hypothetical protein